SMFATRTTRSATFRGQSTCQPTKCAQPPPGSSETTALCPCWCSTARCPRCAAQSPPAYTARLWLRPWRPPSPAALFSLSPSTSLPAASRPGCTVSGILNQSLSLASTSSFGTTKTP
ncbi:hypothetical protein LPJ59_005277, partial [Coemansia sp. RSA 2399]